jgi:predicted HTH transcriptional regulator
MIETVRELISTDRRMTRRMMEEELEISTETIRKVLVKDLGSENLRYICSALFAR